MITRQSTLGIIVLLGCLSVLSITAVPAQAQTSVIAADQGWQSTNFSVAANQQIRLRVESGQWTNWVGTVPPNPGVGTYPCGSAGCVEPLPSAPNGSLIARIGSDLYAIGSGTEITALQSGVIELRINDADNGLYDNAGSLQVAIDIMIPNADFVAASQPWQTVSLLVHPGQTVRVQVAAGQWTHWAGTVAPNPGTGTAPCSAGASCVEPLPSAPIGSLIARIGGVLYPIGSGAEFQATRGGALELRINDADSGLFDNAGELQVVSSVLDPPPPATIRKVSVLVYDPLLSNGQRLSQRLNWQSHTMLTAQTVDFFRQASGGQLEYQVVETTVLPYWPVLADGYQYTEASWFAAYNGGPPPSTAMVDYGALLNNPALDLCGKRNRDEIHELWVYNGPFFGFYESTLAGPGAYFLNSPPVSQPVSCQKLLPIMGPSPERELDSAIHNFGHRMESTMVRAYGDWQQNRASNPWEQFALVKASSPNFSYSGCGSIHYPPNGTSDYDYANTGQVSTNCDDFLNYPNTRPVQDALQTVTCAEWGCEQIGFLQYWFSRLPSAPGCSGGYLNNWWRYFIDPALPTQVPHTPQFCAGGQTSTPTATSTPTSTLTSTPTGTLTSTPTATRTSTPTGTLTSTPVPPGSTPTSPSISPTLTATPGDRGAPGSAFLFTARYFEAGEAVQIAVNGRALLGGSIGADGTLSFVLVFPSTTPPGVYTVTVESVAPALQTAARQAQMQVTIDATAPVLEVPIDQTTPRTNVLPMLYLPIVRR